MTYEVLQVPLTEEQAAELTKLQDSGDEAGMKERVEKLCEEHAEKVQAKKVRDRLTRSSLQMVTAMLNDNEFELARDAANFSMSMIEKNDKTPPSEAIRIMLRVLEWQTKREALAESSAAGHA